MIVNQRPQIAGSSALQKCRVARQSNITMRGGFFDDLDKRIDSAISGAKNGSRESEKMFFQSMYGTQHIDPSDVPQPIRNYANSVLGNKYKMAGAVGGAIKGFLKGKI